MASCMFCGKSDDVMHVICSRCEAETEQKKELIYGKVRELLDGLLCKGAISAEKRDYMLSQLWELLYKWEDR